MKISIYNVVTCVYQEVESIRIASEVTGVPASSITKYVKTPYLGDWPTNGHYFRRRVDLIEYPWRYIKPEYLTGLNPSITPKRLMLLVVHGVVQVSCTTVEAAAKALGIKPGMVSAIIQGELTVHGTTITTVLNPRVLEPNTKRITTDNRKLIPAQLLRVIVGLSGISLRNTKEISYTYKHDRMTYVHRIAIDESNVVHNVNYLLNQRAIFQGILTYLPRNPAYDRVRFYRSPCKTKIDIVMNTMSNRPIKITIPYAKLSPMCYIALLEQCCAFVNTNDERILACIRNPLLLSIFRSG